MRARWASFWAGCGLLAGALLATACVDPFDPPVADTGNDLLVVDGFINTRGVTIIKLSHAFGLKSKEAPPVEKQARVWVEDEQGAQFPLPETTPGTYASAARNLDAARKYRLHFTTKAGHEYASDYTEAKVTPPIDSLTWELNPRGLSVKVNTHDELRRSVYYRWNSDETWEFTSAFYSGYEYRNGQVVQRLYENNIYRCWGQSKSSIISLANSAALTQDRIADFKMLTLPPSSEKLMTRYSVRVQQCAQTLEEYQYWEMMQKNTENIGGLFDPLPSQLTGNVHGLDDPATPVLGFVGAYSVVEKRIFIDRTQLPRGWSTAVDPYLNCSTLLKVLFADVHAMFGHNILVPVEDLPTGYLAGTPECVDCRLRGTNVRPLYWQ